MLPAGGLRQRVTVETKVSHSDGHDGFIEDWAPVQARIAATVTPLSGRDLERAKQVDPRISHQVTLRYWRNYRNDLDGGRGQLIYHDLTDRTLEIVAPPIDVDERHVELTVFCREAA